MKTEPFDLAPRDLLVLLGDALRLGEPVAPSLRQACRSLDDGNLDEALHAMCGELETAPPDVAAWLRARDRAESMASAVTQICLTRGTTPARLPALAPFAQALVDSDAKMRAVIDRATAEERLAERARLLGGAPWTRVLAERAESDGADGAESIAAQSAQNVSALDASALDASALDASALDAAPSDAVVQRYITEGVHRTRVESFALAQPAFADELATVIDALAEMGEERSLVARIFRARRSPASPALVYEIAQYHLALAASSEPSPASQSIQLGPLPGIAAEASLEISPGQVTLHVFATEPLSSVSLAHANGASNIEGTLAATGANTADTSGAYICRIALRPGPLSIRIVATKGASFHVELNLVPGSPT